MMSLESLQEFMRSRTLQSALDFFNKRKIEATSDVIEVAQELQRYLVGRPKGVRGTDTLADVYYKISVSKRTQFLRFVSWQISLEGEKGGRK